jgi:transcriptional regulator with XRE-family HTH domain
VKTIKEVVTSNLQRICRERHLSATDLGRVLGASKSHGSQLLTGKSGVGEETMGKLCAAWNIDETEFIRLDINTDPRIAALEDRLSNIADYVEKMVHK